MDPVVNADLRPFMAVVALLVGEQRVDAQTRHVHGLSAATLHSNDNQSFPEQFEAHGVENGASAFSNYAHHARRHPFNRSLARGRDLAWCSRRYGPRPQAVGGVDYCGCGSGSLGMVARTSNSAKTRAN